jgi:radical SAM protein with 4Fe4S-binding SPASM domain
MKELFHIQWHITNFCNLRCRHCYQDDFSKEKDLGWPELRKISDHILTAMKIWGKSACIHLTGGEPLLKPELFPLLEYLDTDVCVEELGLITNGLLLDDGVTRKLASYPKLKKIKISLDGPEARVNDSIRQKGVFERVIQTVRRLRREDRFDLIFMFTVMKSNYNHLSSFVDGLCVMPEGQVFPCRRFPMPIGNLMNDPLEQLWTNSELLDTLRHKENLKGRCRTCEYSDCRGCRSLAFALTGDYLEEDPHCCHIKEVGL